MSKLFTLLMSIITKLNSKASLVDGKVPKEQLPDDIGGGVPADHTHDISDIDGLLVEETYTELNTIWEYSEDLTPDFSFNLGSMMQHLYKFSDSIDPNSLIGMSFETTYGDIAEITSDMIDSSAGIYHAVLFNGMGYILVFPADFDSSMMGLSGVVSAGSYASIYSTDEGYFGVSKIQVEVETTRPSIAKELLPAITEVDLSGYYTKSDIDNNHYTKSDIDNNHYTKSDIDNNHYTKSEIDIQHQEIRNLIGDCSSVIDSINTLIGGDTV